MLTDSAAPQIVGQIGRIFALRLSPDALSETDRRGHPNVAVALTAAAFFAEDLWTCLGQPTGALLLARPDLKSEAAAATFRKAWRSSVALLLQVRHRPWLVNA